MQNIIRGRHLLAYNENECLFSIWSLKTILQTLSKIFNQLVTSIIKIHLKFITALHSRLQIATLDLFHRLSKIVYKNHFISFHRKLRKTEEQFFPSTSIKKWGTSPHSSHWKKWGFSPQNSQKKWGEEWGEVLTSPQSIVWRFTFRY